ncbi:PAS domain-containing protein [candidate division WWE3 bacterium]|nr:PAS domain-containing protein [candidate division WWE3 bacterium]
MDLSSVHTSPKRLLTPLDLALVHWKIQAIFHFTFGIPLASLAGISWGVSLSSMILVIIAYLGLYFFIYFPFYYFFASIQIKRLGDDFDEINRGGGIQTTAAADVVSRLLNFPLNIAGLIAIIELSAFCIGGYIYYSGNFIPELIPIRSLVAVQVIFLGIVASTNISLLNWILLSNKMSDVASKIIQQYPMLLDSKNLSIRRIPVFTKIFLILLLTTLAGETSIVIFFATYMLSTTPRNLVLNLTFIATVVLINMVYTLIITPIVSNSFILPLKKIAEWIQLITKGQYNEQINYITNDEHGDIILGSNRMMKKLNKATAQLTRSMQRLQEDRSVIELEKNKLSTVLFGVGDGVIALNKEKEIVLMNKASEDLTGTTEGMMLHKPIDKLCTMTDEQGGPLTTSVYCPPFSSKVGAQKESRSYQNVKLITQTGQELYVNLLCSTIPYTDETDATYIVSFHDVTDEHELEEMKLDFVSMAAHELRTPLTSILGYMSVYLKENNSHLNDPQKMMLNRVFYSAQDLTSLVENLLNVSKIERNALNLNFIDLNWGEKVRQIFDTVKFIALEKKITLTCDLPESFSTVVSADATRIGEVLTNLLTNAVNYTQVGGKVKLWIEETPTEVITHISDTGIGIPETAIPHLFTKFFRVSGNLEQGSKGTGLGLYISRAIVEMHKGKIWVESKLDSGSTFSFSLPKKNV